MERLLIFLARFVLGTSLLLAIVNKIGDPATFLEIASVAFSMDTLEAEVLFVFLLSMEAMLSGAILFLGNQPETYLATSSLFLAFIIVILYVLLYDVQANCGCILGVAKGNVSVAALLKYILLATTSFILFVISRKGVNRT